MTKYAKKLQNYDKKVSKKLQIVKNFTILRFSVIKFRQNAQKGCNFGIFFSDFAMRFFT